MSFPTIHLHDSLQKKKRVFEPIDEKNIRVYSCGPTVYDYAHIGNFRSFLMSDLLTRMLSYAGYKVTKVMNITDVGHLTGDDMADAEGEDKIMKKAKAENLSPFDIARMYEDAFVEDETILKIKEPDHRPRATEFIPEQIALTQELIDKGFAYEVNGSVYFRTKKFKTYGELSGNKLEDLIAGARVEVNDEKEDPLDFALWKHAGPEHLMQWDFRNGKEIDAKAGRYKIVSENSKFEESKKNSSEVYESIQRTNLSADDNEVGIVPEQFRGFPGWHLECSAMSRKLLGETFDIHTGGEDNMFPHHECEIAQNEASCGHKSVNYWLHGKHLLVDGQKMSKSKGNFYTIRDLVEKGWKGEEIRLALISAHYRSALNFTEKSLQDAHNTIARINEAYNIIDTIAKNNTGMNNKPWITAIISRYKEALFDDLNVADALAAVFELLSQTMKKRDEKTISPNEAQAVKRFLMFDFNSIFAVLNTNIEAIPAEVQDLLDQRAAAREAKEWQKSDEIRDAINALGYDVKDEKNGQRVTKR